MLRGSPGSFEITMSLGCRVFGRWPSEALGGEGLEAVLRKQGGGKNRQRHQFLVRQSTEPEKPWGWQT